MDKKELQKVTRIIVMLGARMRKTIGGKWSFPLTNKPAEEKTNVLTVEVGGGESRMMAIQALYKEHLEKQETNENLLVLTTGGKEKSGDSRAHEAAKKLVEKYKLPKAIVGSIDSSPNTMGNASAFFEFMKENTDRLGKISEIEIVTNDFHALRGWVMFVFQNYKFSTGKNLKIKDGDIEKIRKILDDSLGEPDCNRARSKVIEIIKPYVKDLKLTIKPVIAEDVILSLDSGGKPRFKNGKAYVERIKKNKWVLKTRELENKGVMDLLTGQYGKKA